MDNITIEDILDKVSDFEDFEKERIRKAYQFAKEKHKGQYRESGEEYITHPLNVAYILTSMKADTNTICAGLLHDTLEDTKTTKEELASEFNEEIANLVDGVTKFPKSYFSSREEREDANNRKMITSSFSDIRIIIIKLADCLHNMRTLKYKKDVSKQKEISLETLRIYVPEAKMIGAHQIKNELEDLSLQYLKPDSYLRIKEEREQLIERSNNSLQVMSDNIHYVLQQNSIKNQTKTWIKNIYGIYKRLEEEGKKLSDIHDLLALKVLVEEAKDCYSSLGFIHELYHNDDSKFKDYIAKPKTNGYQSLHTTLFGEDNRIVQAQIRTFDMEKIATYGLISYWDFYKGEAKNDMQEDIEKSPSFKSIKRIDSMYQHDNKRFIEQLLKECLSGKIYPLTPSGEVIELPVGSTPIDFAYNISSEIGDTMIGALVNGEYVPLNGELKNNDVVQILTNDLAYGHPQANWYQFAKTTKAKQRIKKFLANSC